MESIGASISSNAEAQRNAQRIDSANSALFFALSALELSFTHPKRIEVRTRIERIYTLRPLQPVHH